MQLNRASHHGLNDVFNLLPGEGTPVALLFLLSFLLMGSTVAFADTASNALFLAAWGARGLPYMYLASAILIPFTGALFRWVRRRASLGMLLTVTVALLVITSVAFRLGLYLGGNGWAVGLLLWYRLIYVLTSLIFWGMAGQLFTLRQGKRLFGLVSSGEALAKVICYFAVVPIVGLLGTPNLLLIVAVSLVGSLAVVVVLTRRSSGLRGQPEPAAPQARRRSRFRIQANPYVLLLLLVAALAMWMFALVDFGFATTARQRFPDADHLAGFFGVFYGAINVVRLCARPTVSWLFRRYGLLPAILMLPAALLIGVVGVVLASTFGIVQAVFWTMTATKLLDSVFRAVIQKPTIQLCYQPLAAEERLATQVTAETMVEPVSSGAVGLLLLLLTTTGTVNLAHLADGMLVILVVWIVVAVALNRQYRQTLQAALKRQTLEDGATTFDDASSLAVMEQALGSPHPSAVLYAFELLERASPHILDERLLPLLGHADPAVRLAALRRIAHVGVRSAAPAVERLIVGDPVMRVRAAALQTWCGLAGDDMLDQALRYLRYPDLQMRRGALVGLFHGGEIAGVVVAGQTLLAMVDAADPAERACAAEVLAEIAVRGFYRPVLRLLQDADRSVQRAALVAAGRMRHPSLWPPLVDALGRPALWRSAAAALRSAGSDALPAIALALGQMDHDEVTQIELVRICGGIGGTAAITILKGHLRHPSLMVRREVARVLGRCGYRVPGPEVTEFHNQIRMEVAAAAGVLAALVDIGDGTETALVRDALATEVRRARDHILNLLALCYDRRTMLRVRESLKHGLPTMRAFAMEVIDMVVVRDLRDWIGPLLSDEAPAQRLRHLEPLVPQQMMDRKGRLEALAVDGTQSDWMRACSLYVMDNLGLARVQSTMSNGAESMRSLVERVLVLKTVDIFAHTPDDVLAAVAALLDEEDIPTAHVVFQKGDAGTSMYIIVDGEVRVHDGDHTLDSLGPTDVFGEMALLDPEPRSASVTTVRPTQLLRLDQELFYEVVDERSEVARGIIQVLCQRLRARLRDLDETRIRLKEIERRPVAVAVPEV